MIKRVAAVLAFLLLLPISYWVYLNLRYFEEVSTKPNVESMIQLPDRSSVRLAQGSSVRYHKHMADKQRRWVVLEGEGTFNVVPAPNATFVVETPVAQITVMGTRFTVQVSPGTTTVRVEEGKVSVQAIDANTDVGQPVIVTEGGRVRATSARVTEEAPTAPRVAPPK